MDKKTKSIPMGPTIDPASFLADTVLHGDGEDIHITLYDGMFQPLWTSAPGKDNRPGRRGRAYQEQNSTTRLEVFTRKAKEKESPQFGIRSQKGPDGKIKYYQVISLPLYDSRSKIRRLVEVVADITEKRIFEEKLSRSEKHYRGLFDHSAMAVALCSDQYYIYNVNQRFREIFGYERAEVIGRLNFLDMISSDGDRQQIRKMVASLPQSFEVTLRKKDRDEVVVQAAVDQIPVSGEIIVSLVDITAKRKLEAEIRAKERYLLTVLDGSVDAILSVDADYRISSWNKGAEAIFGFTRDDVVGRTIDFLIPKDRLSEHEIMCRRVLEKGVLKSFETQRLTRDGRLIDVSVTRTLVRDEDGRMIGYAIIIRDITQEKIIKQRLIESERMTTIGELSAILAHEIKNPLNSIIITLEVLKHRVAGVLGSMSSSVEKYFDVITAEIKRLDSVIKNFLDFARPGKEQRVWFSISDTLREVADLVSPEASQKRISVEFKAAQKPNELWAERGQIKQAILNLVLNSMQAMPNGGRLDLVSEYDPLRREEIVIIRDSGVGIPRENLPRIFDLYFTTKEKGSGLGLAIVERVVQGYGGRIEVESELGKGTMFRLIFPMLDTFDRGRDIEGLS